MEGDSRFSYGGEPSGSRMDMSMMMDQHAEIPQHSATLTQPRIMATRGVNPLDLTSAIQHELRRSNVGHPVVWGAPSSNHPLPHQQQQLSGSLNHASAFASNSTGLPVPYGFFQHSVPQQQSIPHCIPRFEEGFAPAALHHLPTTRFDFAPETESSFRSARQGFYSGSSRSTTSGFAPSHPSEQGFEADAQVDSMQSCSPWIERMMHADVTPTPSPINLCPSTTSQRTAGDVSCVLSQTIDLQSCHSSDWQAQSMLRPFSSSETYHDSTVELSADLCTDDDDVLDTTRPLDVKRKKRMLSNRASAQRSRQRRQERLDQLEVLTAKLRVENSTLQKKLVTAIQLARKFEDQNKDLVKKVDRLSNELENGSKRARKLPPASKFNDCANSQQTTACASSCEMVGERPGVDPHAMRDRHTSNKNHVDDDAAAATPSSKCPPWGIRSPPEYHHDSSHHHETLNHATGAAGAGSDHGISPVRKAFSACRMESKKRSHDHLESELRENSGGVEPGRPLWHELCHNNSMPASHPPSSSSLQQEDGAVDCLEADRWLEFTECFL